MCKFLLFIVLLFVITVLLQKPVKTETIFQFKYKISLLNKLLDSCFVKNLLGVIGFFGFDLLSLCFTF